jgi:hypothetical protein
VAWHLDLSDVSAEEVVQEITRYARTTETTFYLTTSGGSLDVGGVDADTVVTHLTGKFPQLRVTEDTVA